MFFMKNKQLEFNTNLDKYYYYGNKSLLNDNSLKLGVVGSRNISSYTMGILETLFEELKDFDFTIVSGGMYGVDIYSHNLALKNNLKTICVLPQGIETYRSSSLYSQLRNVSFENLLLLSEYENNFLPRKYSYLERNKLICKLSSSIFVAQAGTISGSISTGLFALKNSIKVLCPPFPLDNMSFQGTNLLISKGAKIYLKPQDILDIFSLNKKSIEGSILKILINQPSSILEICELCDSNTDLVRKNLLELILKGQIFFDGEKYFL